MQSVLSQTYGDLELIVVDDGSTDGTADVVRDIRDGRVRYVHQENGGPPVARNTGIREARGEFIAFLDSDDHWHREKVERQVAAFDADPALQWCITHAQNYWSEELAEEADRMADTRRSRPVPGYVSQCLMARRSLFDRIGGYDEERRYVDNADWFGRAKDAGAQGCVLPDTLVFRRVHPDNMSRTEGSGHLDELFELLRTRVSAKRDRQTKHQDS